MVLTVLNTNEMTGCCSSLIVAKKHTNEKVGLEENKPWRTQAERRALLDWKCAIDGPPLVSTTTSIIFGCSSLRGTREDQVDEEQTGLAQSRKT